MSSATLDPALARYEERLDRSDPARLAAWERFVELGGFPGPRDESWRQTPVKGIASGAFAPAEAIDVVRALEGAGLGAWKECVVVSNGVAAAPAPAGAASIAPEDHPFVVLNTALHGGGAVVQVPAGTRREQPLHVIVLSVPSPAAVEHHARVVIEVGSDASASILQSHVTVGDGAPVFSTVITEITAADGAQVEHTVWQDLGSQAQHVAITQAELGRDARVTFNGFTHGGAMVRNEVRARFTAPGAESHMHGLYLGSGDSVIDYHTHVDHRAPDTTSRQLYKGVLAGKARGVFEGHVHIAPGAVRTSAEQSNRNLLLSDGAGVHTKPLLEIHNDDVQCAHGAAIGRLDPMALFYLRARGIPFAQAQQMLAQAFADEVVNRVGDDAVRAWLAPRVLAALPTANAGGGAP